MRSSIAIGPVYSLRSSSYGHIVYCRFSFLNGDDDDHADMMIMTVMMTVVTIMKLAMRMTLQFFTEEHDGYMKINTQKQQYPFYL